MSLMYFGEGGVFLVIDELFFNIYLELWKGCFVFDLYIENNERDVGEGGDKG